MSTELITASNTCIGGMYNSFYSSQVIFKVIKKVVEATITRLLKIDSHKTKTFKSVFIFNFCQLTYQNTTCSHYFED